MRSVASALFLLCCTAMLLPACGERAIGQPCTFSWPRTAGGEMDCKDYPTCAPLQDTSLAVQSTARNDACPIDCIQMPSLQCENLICVATQIEGDPNHINGECSQDLMKATECDFADDGRDAPLGCLGYCTKDCLSDASCPKGYSCSPMAPFGSTLKCDDEEQWGTICTSSCTEEGQTPQGETVTCPSSKEGDPSKDYGLCELDGYASCCTCICYRFCSLLSRKFCRKSSWDEGMFPEATTNASDCGGGT